MPTTLQSKKRLRQNERTRDRNKSTRSALRTQVRKFQEAIAAGEADNATALLRTVYSQLDRAAKTNLMKKNTVNRKKSNLTKKLVALTRSA